MRKTKGEGFEVSVRREAGYANAVAVRFAVRDGRGVLAIDSPGRNNQPTPEFELREVDAVALKGGRFVHVLPDGSRRSYSMSRVTPDQLGALSTEKWTNLKITVELGFRYLDIPEGAGASAAAAVAVATPRASSPPAGYRAPAKSKPKGAGDPLLVTRPVPMPAQLAGGALANLSHKDAIRLLGEEIQKVAELHEQVVELQRALAHSASREADLIQLLDQWRKRELDG